MGLKREQKKKFDFLCVLNVVKAVALTRVPVSVDFATGWLDGADALQKLSSESLEAVSEFSAFVKKLSKLEQKFGVELSQLIAKDGKKRTGRRRAIFLLVLSCLRCVTNARCVARAVLERDALHGTTRDFVSVFLAQLVDVAKSAFLLPL